MRGALRTVFIAAAALAAAVVLFVGFTLPPRRATLVDSRPPGVLFGAFHVHTSRSDGTGSVEDVAAAAKRAGLDFVILADHGDATRPPLTPQYIDGVLVIDAVEISTSSGHVVALGLTEPAPYPLAGDAADVIEDVHRLGGLVVLAHPNSPRAELRWRGSAEPYDGFEWLNADSEWRDESPGRLLVTAARGVFRGPESVVSLFARQDRAFVPWDGRGDRPGRRRTFGVAAVDAHARIGWDADEEQSGGWAILAKPSYEEMFRALAQVVDLGRATTGRADDDSRRVLGALTTGRTYSIISGLAGPATLDFHVEHGGRRTEMGERVPAGAGVFHAAVEAAPETTVILLQNGRAIAEGRGKLTVAREVEDGAVYRVEAMRDGRAFPWIVSNPIYGGEGGAPAPADVAMNVPPSRAEPVVGYADWRIERDGTSTASMAVDETIGALVWRFELGAGRPAGQFTALSVPVEGDAGYESVVFSARANRPMRLSFQVRLPGSRDGQRWGKSIYLDEGERRVVVRLEDLQPIGRTTSLRPVVSRIRSLLFVVDTVNAHPGSTGEIVLSDVSLGLGDTGGT